MANISLPLTYALLFAAFTGLVGAGAIATQDIPACEDLLDIVTGCGSTVSAIFAAIAIGTIPGAPSVVNAFFGIIGVSIRVSVLMKLAKLIPGVG